VRRNTNSSIEAKALVATPKTVAMRCDASRRFLKYTIAAITDTITPARASHPAQAIDGSQPTRIDICPDARQFGLGTAVDATPDRRHGIRDGRPKEKEQRNGR
jgi:hypothetical protein